MFIRMVQICVFASSLVFFLILLQGSNLEAMNRRQCERLLDKIEESVRYKEAFSELTNVYKDLSPAERIHLLSAIRDRVEQGLLPITELERKELDRLYVEWLPGRDQEVDQIEGLAIYNLEQTFGDLQKTLESFLKSSSSSNYLKSRIENLMEDMRGELGEFHHSMSKFAKTKKMVDYLSNLLIDERLPPYLRLEIAELCSLLTDDVPSQLDKSVYELHSARQKEIDAQLVVLINAVLNHDPLAKIESSNAIQFLEARKSPFSIGYIYPTLQILSSLPEVEIADREVLQQSLLKMRFHLEKGLQSHNPYFRVHSQLVLSRMDPLVIESEYIPNLISNILKYFNERNGRGMIKAILQLSKNFDLENEVLVFYTLRDLKKKIVENPKFFKSRLDQNFIEELLIHTFRMHTIFIQDRKDALELILSESPDHRELRRTLKTVDRVGGTAQELQIHFRVR